MRLFALLCALPVAWATSSAAGISQCNAMANFGCTGGEWELKEDGTPNRLSCLAENAGPMPWVMEPDSSEFFSIRAGEGEPANDLTSYTPGKFISIYIRALKYTWNWRGLLLHAVNSEGETVGSWEFAQDDQAMFWSPPQCPGTAMHRSAEVKPYLVQIRFEPPAEGTGTITFRCLLKRGPANDGWFHRPAVELSLTEAAGGETEDKWFALAAGESCEAKCGDKGGADSDAMALTGVEFERNIEHALICSQPSVNTCADTAPAMDSEHCYFKAPASECTDSWRATALPSDARQLCACKKGYTPPDTDPKLSGAGRGRGLTLLAFVLPVLSLLSFPAFSARSGASTVVSLCLLSLVLPSATAHNWLHTPGRASFQASTVAPCQGRKSSDLHAQVGPDQDFTIKWATGHCCNTWFVVLAGEDAHMLASSNFAAMLDEYIADAEAQGEPNRALPSVDTTGRYQRYHGVPKPDDFDVSAYDDGSDPIGTQFQRKVAEGDANFLDHPRQQTTHLYQYKASMLSGDVRYTYTSNKEHLKWIESAFRYEHLYHLPSDYDAIQLSIPGNKGAGHYIVHWRWNGYYDCIDVDRRDSQVAAPSGVMPDPLTFIYNRIDHCQYQEPKQLWTSCMEVTHSIEYCKTEIPGWINDRRIGLQVVPLKNPDSVYPGFSDELAIPWRDGHCSSSWNRLYGSVSEKMSWVSAFWAQTTRTPGVACTAVAQWPWNSDMRVTTDLKRAVARCAGSDVCVGLTTSIDVDTDTAGPDSRFDFKFCTALTTEANAEAAVFFPDSLSSVTYTPEAKVTVNFAPPHNAATPPAPSIVDKGAAYGVQTGGTFGWNCKDWREVYGQWADYHCLPSGTPARLCNEVDADESKTYVTVNGNCYDHTAGKYSTTVKYWDMEVSNGVYSIGSYHDNLNGVPTIDIGGCTVENVRLAKDDGSPNRPAHLTGTLVEVTDGKLTLWGADSCWALNYLTVERQGDTGAWDQVWMPSVANPWWQMVLDQREPVGIVEITNFDATFCSHWWLYKGSRCYESRTMGWFNDTAQEGALVYVSDIPCTNDLCASAHLCGEVRFAGNAFDYTTDHFIDCNGVLGKVVTVVLRGANRILAAEIKVHRTQPAVLPEDSFVCYGVEARETTTTKPEFITTNDVMDPIFYSTCYAREADVTWLPIGQEAPEPHRWKWNKHCLDCKAYHANKASQADPNALPVHWKIASPGQCLNCELETPPMEPSSNFQKVQGGTLLDAPEANWGVTPACADNAGSCRKRLFMAGREDEDNTGQRTRFTFEECQMMVERDPECGSTMEYELSWWTFCRCWRKDACCGEAGTQAYSSVDEDAGDELAGIYDNTWSKVADPSCDRDGAIKSADETLCCPSHCVDDAGESVCGVERWLCGTTVSGGGLGCCKEVVTASCTESAAPCLL